MDLTGRRHTQITILPYVTPTPYVILGAKWQDRVKNIDIADRTGLTNIADIISKRREAPFGHVVRLDATTPAHQALCQVIAMKGGQSLGMNWGRSLGRFRKTWITADRQRNTGQLETDVAECR